MNKNYLVTTIFVIAILLIGAWFFKFANQTNNQTSQPVNLTPSQASATVLTLSADQLDYLSERYHFTLAYPKEFKTQEFNEGEDSLTVTFQDPVLGRDFQIFITPYGEDHVTEERFRRDIPSGQIAEPTEILVSGARGVMFFSQNPVMGETKEVWFIKDGYLYEVTTYRELDNWLSQIMATWQWL